jgi:hypothetical protein
VLILESHNNIIEEASVNLSKKLQRTADNINIIEGKKKDRICSENRQLSNLPAGCYNQLYEVDKVFLIPRPRQNQQILFFE